MVREGINLLPQKLQEQEEKEGLFRRISFGCILELALLMAVVLAVYSYRCRVGARWSSLTQEVIDQHAFINQEDNQRLEGKLLVVKEKIEALRAHFDARGAPASFFEGLVTRLPVGVSLITLKQAGSSSQFEFSGRADNLDQVNHFVEQLDQWDEITAVSLQSLDYQLSKDVLIFSLSITRKIS